MPRCKLGGVPELPFDLGSNAVERLRYNCALVWKEENLLVSLIL